MTTDTLFKVLWPDGRPCHGGVGQWALPTPDGPGEWMPPIEGSLVPCKHGYHLCTADQLIRWLGPAIFVAESRGDVIADGEKLVAREARLVRQVASWHPRAAFAFATDCVERLLPLFEAGAPDDDRPRTAIAVARRFAKGEATAEELASAARGAQDAWEIWDYQISWDTAPALDAWDAWVFRAGRVGQAAGAIQIARSARDAHIAETARANRAVWVARLALDVALAVGATDAATRVAVYQQQTDQLMMHFENPS